MKVLILLSEHDGELEDELYKVYQEFFDKIESFHIYKDSPWSRSVHKPSIKGE